MKRLYYLTNDLDFAEHISDELVRNDIDIENIHVLSKNESGVITHHLKGPSLFERLDFIRSGLYGMLTGLIVGIISMYTAMYLFSIQMPGIGQLAFLMFMMLFGSWIGGLVGFAHENVHLKRFHSEVEKGRHLIMIDINPSAESRVHRLIDLLHEADFAGEDDRVIL